MILFKCKTNKKYVAVNTLICKNKETGEEVIIDRDTTEYTRDKNFTFMIWKDPYIWDGNEPNYDINEINNIIKFDNPNYTFKFDIEDDAPSDYEIEIKNIVTSIYAMDNSDLFVDIFKHDKNIST